MRSFKQATEHAQCPQDLERRDGDRSLTTYRLVRVRHRHDEGLARCRNISDSGMKLELTMDIAAGERIEIIFSQTAILPGQVIWVDGRSCGVQFAQRIDSEKLLASTAVEGRSPGARPPRLRVETTAIISYDDVAQEVVVEDVSLRGMKILHDGELGPGLRILIALKGQSKRHGVVRWSRGRSAGLMLLEPFSVEELGSLRSIGGRCG